MKTTWIRAIAIQVLIVLLILGYGAVRIGLYEINNDKMNRMDHIKINYQTKTFECISMTEHQAENYGGAAQNHYESVLYDAENNSKVTVDFKAEIGKIYTKHCATIVVHVNSNKYNPTKIYNKESNFDTSLEEFKLDIQDFIANVLNTKVSQTEFIIILIMISVLVLIVMLCYLTIYIIIKPQKFIEEINERLNKVE